MITLKRLVLVVVVTGLIGLAAVSLFSIAPALAQGPGWMMGRGGMIGAPALPIGRSAGVDGYGPGWMMGTTQAYTGTSPYGYGHGWMHHGFGPRGMMGGYGPGWGYQGEQGSGFYGHGFGGMMGRGAMMWSGDNPFFATEPLSLAEASAAVEAYLAELNQDNLELGEVMIFDNHAYAQIVEQDSGIGAMEVLVDPATKAVYPEMGPNMMWNLKYGMMAGFGGFGRFGGYGMMGRFGYLPGQGTPGDLSAEMPVSPAAAVEAAQRYLDTYFENKFRADEHTDPFYGYYTLHVNEDGQTIGMLSVNGYTGQVFLHTWHGNLLEMSGE